MTTGERTLEIKNSYAIATGGDFVRERPQALIGTKHVTYPCCLEEARTNPQQNFRAEKEKQDIL